MEEKSNQFKRILSIILGKNQVKAYAFLMKIV